MSRPVVTSAGASEPRGMLLTDVDLQDVSTCTYETQLTSSVDEPTSAGWESVTPIFSIGEGSTVTNVAKVEVDVDAANTAGMTTARQHVRVTDGEHIYVLSSPEVIPLA